MSDSHAQAEPLTPRRCLIAAAVATVVALVVLVFQTQAFFFGYLAAWLFAISTVTGAGALLMVHVLSGGRWGWSMRRPGQRLVSALPVLAVLVIPVMIGISWLYPWAYADPGKFEHQRVWHGPILFILRSVFFLGLWWFGAWVLTRRRAPEDTPVHDWPSVCSGRFAAGGLVVLAVSMSFAQIDWLASLETLWYSTVFGLYVIMAGVLSAHALLVIRIVWPVRNQSLDENQQNLLIDLGNFLLMLVVIHAYMAFSQFFLIWNGNLPQEAVWFEPRLHGFWGGLYGFIALTHFLLPFWALLFRVVKRTPKTLLLVCSVVLGARVLDAAWMVIPSRGAKALGWGDLWAGLVFLCMTIAIGAVSWALIRWRSPGPAYGESTLVLDH